MAKIYDVIVVGGGPAGLAAAVGADQRGANVAATAAGGLRGAVGSAVGRGLLPQTVAGGAVFRIGGIHLAGAGHVLHRLDGVACAVVRHAGEVVPPGVAGLAAL